MKDIVKDPVHEFEFFVIEHRPEGFVHAQATRTLRCLEFSKNGLTLSGTSRYARFSLTLCMPPMKDKVEAEVEVTKQDFDTFNVRFIHPSDVLLEKIDWWNDSHDLSFQEDGSDV